MVIMECKMGILLLKAVYDMINLQNYNINKKFY